MAVLILGLCAALAVANHRYNRYLDESALHRKTIERLRAYTAARRR
ncbi:MAG: hypothetical protein WC273_09035 [Dehalococcoidia bacterium]